VIFPLFHRDFRLALSITSGYRLDSGVYRLGGYAV